MIEAIVTDIEGTTSSLSFVKDVLFPYARARMDEFVRKHGDDPAVRALLNDVAREAGRTLSDAEAIALLQRWIDEDRKITPLKALQGMIWKQGYAQGDFTGHIYEDAVEYLRRWHAQGIRLYVFSSGSVQAQKLLFAHTEYGDLTPLFAGWFDTNVGSKREAGAYDRIGKEIGSASANILFLSDIREELDAAAQSGMRTCWLIREGAIDPQSPHPQARNFREIEL